MVKFSDKDQTWATLYYSERRDDFQCTSCGHEISDTSMIDDMPVDVTPSWHSVKYSIPCPECGGEAVCEVPLYCPLAMAGESGERRPCSGPLCAWYNKCSRENHVAKKEEQDKVWIGTNGMIYKGEVKESKSHGH